MKTILLPTDFSASANNAIAYAMQLYSGEVCTFFVLHVQKASQYTTDDLMTAPANSTIHQTVVQSAKEKVEHCIDTLIAQYPSEKYTFKPVIDYDVFTDTIQQIVQTKLIDIIVMGTNGATGAKEVVFGSNTLNVIRKVDCPVITVPHTCSFTTPKTILYLLGDDIDAIDTTLLPLQDIYQRYTATIRILNIREDDIARIEECSCKRKTNAFFEGATHTFHSITNVPTAQAIDSFVQIMNIDMTAMISTPESFLQRFFTGSTIASISYSSRVPLLIMHP